MNGVTAANKQQTDARRLVLSVVTRSMVFGVFLRPSRSDDLLMVAKNHCGLLRTLCENGGTHLSYRH
jgi:hypothetical protein